MSFKGTAGFAGAGKMGGILIKGLIKAKMIPPEKVVVYDVDESRTGQLKKQLGVGVAATIGELTHSCDVLFLCVKPDQFPVAAEEIKATWADRKPCCVSIMAGVKTALIKDLVEDEAPVIRVMPNVACMVGKGAAGIAKDVGASDEVNQFVFDLFEALGGAVWVPESKMDAVTALSGSGPAYVFMFIEALTDAGVNVGLDRATSEKLAVRTVTGAATMVDQTNFNTLELRAQVSSPGGTTVAATTVLEKAGFRSAIIAAVESARDRAEELGKK